MDAHPRTRRGYTLIEILTVVAIVGIVASVTLVVGARAIGQGRAAAERQLVVSLNVAVQQFKQEFGFLPPLTLQPTSVTPAASPLSAASPRRPVLPAPPAQMEAYLRSDVQPDDPRYSEYSLAYYLMGALDVPDMGTPSRPVDGEVGSAFTAPQPDGSFLQAGKVYSAFFDVSTGGRERLVRDAALPERITIRDRWGNGVRYYRWLPRYTPNTAANRANGTAGQLEQYMVPRAVGDPNTSPELRDAEYAIVSLGPDGQTDVLAGDPVLPLGQPRQRDQRPIQRGATGSPQTSAGALGLTTRDNIVETGR